MPKSSTVKANRMSRNLFRVPQVFCCTLSLFTMSGAAPAGAGEFAYVGNQGPGTISIIDTASDAVTRTLPDQGKIGAKIQAVVTDRGGKTAFVVDADSNALIAVDVASGHVKQRIEVGQSPEGASLSPSGKTIAVCVEDDNVVTLVDVATEKVTRKIKTQGKNPEHCVYSSDEKWMMTSNENSDDVDIIDVKAGRSVALVHTTGHPRGFAWLPNKPIAYVVQERSGGVDVVDAVKRALVGATIPTGLRPADAIASLDGKHVFVSNGGAGTLSVVDTAAGNVVATLAVGKRPWNMAITHDGKKIYVANGRSNSVSVIDTTTLAVIKEIPVGELPWGVNIP
ncbi:MAG: beta-propeller fold lactonase family protein [Steroidobacteraceae bacterium]